MPKLKDLTGQRFGRLTVLERAENNKWGQRKYLCKCDCGREIVTLGKNLCNGRVKSCGCARASEKNLQNLEGMQFGDLKVLERAEIGYTLWKCRCICGAECIVASHDLISGKKKSCGCRRGQNHKMSGTPIYNLWQHIKLRCFNPEYAGYENYGGRGITICDEWLNFQAFYDYISKLEHCGEEGYTIDRIDVNGNYEPGNVRFAIQRTQSRNKRNNIYADYFGKRTLVVDIAKLTGIKYTTLVRRLKKGLNDVDLIKPVKKVVPKNKKVKPQKSAVQDEPVKENSSPIAEKPNVPSTQIFSNEEFGEIRGVMIDGEPYFVAADVCKALDIGNPSQAMTRLKDNEKMTITNNEGHSGKRGGAQKLNVVNEPGLYRLIFASRKPEAEKFQDWIYHEVLPAIRKTGKYEVNAAPKEKLSLVQKIETLKFLVEHSPNDEVKISYLEKIAALI